MRATGGFTRDGSEVAVGGHVSGPGSADEYIIVHVDKDSVIGCCTANWVCVRWFLWPDDGWRVSVREQKPGEDPVWAPAAITLYPRPARAGRLP